VEAQAEDGQPVQGSGSEVMVELGPGLDLQRARVMGPRASGRRRHRVIVPVGGFASAAPCGAQNGGMQNLMPEPPATLLPADEAASASGLAPEEVAARYPTSSVAWATLAEQALAEGRMVQAYAFARTGYHRGLDQLRRNGWKGHGPIPWEHEPNRGFLRSLYYLGMAAEAIEETEEAQRCAAFLRDSSETAARELQG